MHRERHKGLLSSLWLFLCETQCPLWWSLFVSYSRPQLHALRSTIVLRPASRYDSASPRAFGNWSSTWILPKPSLSSLTESLAYSCWAEFSAASFKSGRRKPSSSSAWENSCTLGTLQLPASSHFFKRAPISARFPSEGYDSASIIVRSGGCAPPPNAFAIICTATRVVVPATTVAVSVPWSTHA